MSAAPLPEGDRIRGISIKQPWATAILTGAKQGENRPQHGYWRTWVLLHASQQIDRPAPRLPLVARTIRDQPLYTGAVVGIARITDYHKDPDGVVGMPGYQDLRNRRVAVPRHPAGPSRSGSVLNFVYAPRVNRMA